MPTTRTSKRAASPGGSTEHAPAAHRPAAHVAAAMALLLTLAPGCAEEPRSQTGGATGAQDTRPNIVLILADDLGMEGFGCYGGELTPSPNVDALSASGVRFTDAHTTPLCTPTRVRLMTGRCGPRSYTGFRTLDPSERTFAHQLQAAGYTTAAVGKWQLSGDRGQVASDLPGSLPGEAGFDRWCLWQVTGLGSRYADPTLEIDGQAVERPGEYGPDVFVDYAAAFLAEPHDAPFLLYYPMVLPHDPFEPTPHSLEAKAADGRASAAELELLASEAEPARKQRHFRDMVAYTDHNVGRLLEALDRAGHAADTLVVFATDNGSSRHLRAVVDGVERLGSKSNTTELGTHMPLVLCWPGHVEAGTTFDAPVDLMDLMPTLVEAGGAALPEGRVIDGISLVPALGGRAAWPREVLTFDYDPYPGIPGKRRARWARGLGLKLYADGRIFRTAGDPNEYAALQGADLTEVERTALARLEAALAELPER
ncbi:MAG: sulfatase-like hydrolase/transferase [Planctomycetota bacterium]|nr:sulfatase-like hydrolase/transferase [Planctomycetota bacterium]